MHYVYMMILIIIITSSNSTFGYRLSTKVIKDEPDIFITATEIIIVKGENKERTIRSNNVE